MGVDQKSGTRCGATCRGTARWSYDGARSIGTFLRLLCASVKSAVGKISAWVLIRCNFCMRQAR